MIAEEEAEKAKQEINNKKNNEMENLMIGKNENDFTSLKLAEITGELHENIVSDIRDEISKIGEKIGELIFQPVNYTDKKGEERHMYQMNKKGWLQMALRYDAKMRYTLIDYTDMLVSNSQNQF